MNLTQLQKDLIQEMVEQGTSKEVINTVMSRLTTVEHQQEMMDYLISTRNPKI